MGDPPMHASQLQYQSMKPSGYTEQSATIKFNTLPFAAGEERAAYEGRLLKDGKWSKVVLKKYYSNLDFSGHLQAVYLQKLARFVAKQFNAKQMDGCLPVDFADAVVVRMADGSLWILELKLPEGEFVKFNNNVCDWTATRLNQALLQFAAFSMQISKGRFAVADLQGVMTDKDIMLTDPVIITNDCTECAELGVNWGPPAMLAYKQTSSSYIKAEAWKDSFRKC